MRRLVGLGLAVVSLAALACHPDAPVAAAAATPPLRICADPDNLPFSNARGEGFENRLAELLARDLGTRIAYTWWAQRRGFLRQTLNAGRCDVVLGLPARIDAARTTRPYYRSSYVFVDRGRGQPFRSLDDARLRTLRIGVPSVSDDGANAPPAHALARRGLIDNLVHVSVYGEGSGPAPGERLVGAVASRDLDVAAAWGPVAGYYAARQAVPLRVTAIEPQSDGPALPLAFDVSMATRRDDTARHAALEAFLIRRRVEIDRLLAAFHVPRVARPEGAAF